MRSTARGSAAHRVSGRRPHLLEPHLRPLGRPRRLRLAPRAQQRVVGVCQSVRLVPSRGSARSEALFGHHHRAATGRRRARVSEGHGARSDRVVSPWIEEVSATGSPTRTSVGAWRHPARVPADRRPGRRRGPRPGRSSGSWVGSGSSATPTRSSPYLRRTIVNLSKNHFGVERSSARTWSAWVRRRGRQHRPGRRHLRLAPLGAAPAPAPPTRGTRPPLLRGPPGHDDRRAPPLPSGHGPLARRARPRGARTTPEVIS